MAGLQELRDRAKALNIPSSLIRQNMNNAAALETLIAGFEKGQKLVSSVKAKNKGGSKVAVKAKAKAKAKVGRPATRRPVERKHSPRRSVAKAKPKVTKPVARKKTSSDGSGRHLLGKINFNQTDGWNPRDGSAPDRIIKALKKAKGNRSAAFDALKKDVWDFVGKTKANGEKRDREDAFEMLRYRISRTLFDFAKQTGQHEVSTNRVKYGTGGTGKAKPKAAKRGRPAKKAAVPAKAKRGRPAKKSTATTRRKATSRRR